VRSGQEAPEQAPTPIAPIPERREAFAQDHGVVRAILPAGTRCAREVAGATLAEVKEGRQLLSSFGNVNQSFTFEEKNIFLTTC
jgi:hypothetical protein